MNRLSKVVKLIITALLIIILAVNALTILFSAIGIREPFKWLPYALLTVKSGSMEPVFSAGDALLVNETPYDDLEIGDIITFHNGTELVTHEIIAESNNKYITKGRANNYKDEPVGPEEYCAKVIYILPKVGWVLNFLSKPLDILLISVLLLILFYGKPALGYIYDKTIKSSVTLLKLKFRIESRRPGYMRLIALLTSISLFAVLPFMTAAKYTARLNQYATFFADSINFKSNYLTEDGSVYYIRGWKGQTYVINLEIMNYSNDLLFNRDNQDLIYGLGIKPYTSDDSESYAVYGTDYEISLTPITEGLVQLTGDHVPFSYPADWPSEIQRGCYLLRGNDDGGLTHKFELRLTALNTLAKGAKLRFDLMAATSWKDQFFMELLGKYTLEVMDDSNFIGSTDITQSADSALVTYSLKTNLIDDVAPMKEVKISWNDEKLYINQYDTLASSYYTSGNSITIPMQAFSNITLQFFKYKLADVIVNDEDIYAELVTD